ncbi:CUT1 ABC transporter ATP-binding protein [Pontimonas salivibrio]|uniref:CUT1 ABC transporter ATP-binding protein n=1 Tax=Pontimonas salivibrio TaxID=1159327 RepID=A0A2L2BS15_9MICO|nr:ABC transporter ATP-binding protein [Pontimonas salivibrio]AVG24465.1 CUT1 ABC transporter ATP-binding protein [Pontimonas salivibrio]
MTLELRNVSLSDRTDDLLYDISATFHTGMNVLVGPTLSGKTTLMRLIAGLVPPTEGQILLNGTDITKTTVRDRSVSFVYQQFINYPAMSVFDNIASPLKVSKDKPSKEAIAERVEELAELLGLTPLLTRKPSQLSGGQQQRVAIARALSRKADILLLDEPLANLDYKLREQLRDELQRIFADADNIVMYSTAEPAEALDFGVKTFVLSKGRLVQEGPALDLYQHPDTVEVAKVLSDPPINLVTSTHEGAQASFGDATFTFDHPSIGDRKTYQLGIHPHRIRMERSHETEVEFHGSVQLAEVTGSITFLHLELPTGEYAVIELDGAFPMDPDTSVTAYFDPQDLHGFDADSGEALFAPTRGSA